ncbi:hypothetical protein UA44_23095, partial [Klebsiella aerogenes]
SAASVPPAPQADEITPAQLAEQLREPGTVVLDFTTSANYVARHIPGAWWLARSQLRQALERIPPANVTLSPAAAACWPAMPYLSRGIDR